MEKNNANWILNTDGSIYHLCLKPEDVPSNILTVGDPDRVPEVSRHFDTIHKKIRNREFEIHIGKLGGHDILAMSTGMGTDNIDIVMQELDALVNVDFSTMEAKPEIKNLKIIRLGTSASIQPHISVDQILLTDFAISMDNLHRHYVLKRKFENYEMELFPFLGMVHVTRADADLLNQFQSPQTILGNTLTAPGFYGPQGRKTRLPLREDSIIEKLSDADFSFGKITNMEMETSGIYSLGESLGHKCLSVNAILAQRNTNQFSTNPAGIVKQMIEYVFSRLVF